MYNEPDSLTRLKINLEDMRPGKKPFPERNWHYLSNLGQNFTGRLTGLKVHSPTNQTPKAESKEPADTHRSHTIREYKAMRKQLELEGNQFKERQRDLSHRSGIRQTFAQGTHSLSPSHKSRLRTRLDPLHTSSGKVYQLPPTFPKNLAEFSSVSRKVYFTKKSPKPQSIDPITGLPPKGSPLREFTRKRDDHTPN